MTAAVIGLDDARATLTVSAVETWLTRRLWRRHVRGRMGTSWRSPDGASRRYVFVDCERGHVALSSGYLATLAAVHRMAPADVLAEMIAAGPRDGAA